MRVGIIALQHESNTFLPQRTTLEHFQAETLVTGKALIDTFAAAHHEVGGFIEGLTQQRIEPVPIFAARAVPSGIVTATAYRALLGQMLRELSRAGKLEGLLVAPHGAGVSEEEADMDGHWLAQVRSAVGPDLPIVCTLDLHANLSRRMIAACNAIIAYRSNPHLDQRQRGLEAASLIARTLRGEIRPTTAAAFPPVAINIARQETSQPPCTELLALADAQLRRPAVLSNSCIFGFPYADVAEMGSSFVAVTDNDARLAQALADELAGYLVEHRADFAGNLPDVEEAIDQAMALDGAVCLLDVGDNVGGGSAADGTTIAQALHRRRIGPAFVCLFDPSAVAQSAAAGVGAALSLEVGGKSDNLHGPPLAITARVAGLYDGKYQESQPRHGGKTHYDMGRCAVVATESGLTILLTTRRTPPFSLQMLRCCGLRPEDYRILVAKGVNAPIAAYQEVCRHFIRVNTPGVTTADMTALPFTRRRRPMFPFEPLELWRD